jgi:hypothetical protein
MKASIATSILGGAVIGLLLGVATFVPWFAKLTLFVLAGVIFMLTFGRMGTQITDEIEEEKRDGR